MRATKSRATKSRARRNLVALAAWSLCLLLGPLASAEELGEDCDPLAPAPGALSEPITLSPRARPAPPLEEATRGEEEPWVAFRVQLGAWATSVAGYVQTPRGGRPFSTSQRRPTLNELGLDGLSLVPDIDLALSLKGHELHLHHNLLQLQGSTSLRRGLISQGLSFGAGERIRSRLTMQLVRFGYRLRWLQLELGGWSLQPELGLTINTFRYTIDPGGGGESVDRGYAFGAPYLGLRVSRQLTRRLSLEFDLAASALVNGVTLIDLGASLGYTLYFVDEEPRITAVLGLRGMWLRRKDNQPLEQNDANLRLGVFSGDPLSGLSFGVRFSF